MQAGRSHQEMRQSEREGNASEDEPGLRWLRQGPCKPPPLHFRYCQSWGWPCVLALYSAFGHLQISKSRSGPASAKEGFSLSLTQNCSPELFRWGSLGTRI